MHPAHLPINRPYHTIRTPVLLRPIFANHLASRDARRAVTKATYAAHTIFFVLRPDVSPVNVRLAASHARNDTRQYPVCPARARVVKTSLSTPAAFMLLAVAYLTFLTTDAVAFSTSPPAVVSLSPGKNPQTPLANVVVRRACLLCSLSPSCHFLSRRHASSQLCLSSLSLSERRCRRSPLQVRRYSPSPKCSISISSARSVLPASPTLSRPCRECIALLVACNVNDRPPRAQSLWFDHAHTRERK